MATKLLGTDDENDGIHHGHEEEDDHHASNTSVSVDGGGKD